MTNQKQNPAARNQSRRDMTRKVAAGVSVAALSWQKPVVESVLLPAHAQTSGDAGPSCVVPLVCAATGGYACGSGGSSTPTTISSESATICPAESGATILRDVVRVNAAGLSDAMPGSTNVFTTDASGIATGPGIVFSFGVIVGSGNSSDNNCFVLNGVFARYTLLGVPDVEPCLVELPRTS